MNKKIIIIGSNGFIGSHCMSYFLSKKIDVYGCDVNPDYKLPNYFWINASNSNFKPIFEKFQFDFCINCSGAANVGFSFEEPLVDFELNTGNVYKILTAIKETQEKCKFINLSSAAVYGEPLDLPIEESHVVKPISPYGQHKYYSELICNEFATYYGINTCSLRIFSAYGPGLRKQLFWDLFNKASRNEEVLLFGDGTETRDFIHIYDLVRLLFLLSEQEILEYPVLNAANGIETSISEVVDIFFNHYPETIRYKFEKKARIGDPSNWVADITKIRDLGYKSLVSLDEGLEKYIEWALKEER